MTARPYQTQTLAAIVTGFETFTRQLAVLPTGSGKTIIFSWLAKHYLPERTLILAHREELIDQAIAKLHAATGIVAEKEKAEYHASLTAPVVVASVQSMIRRLAKWPADHFGLVVADEGHHCLSNSWQTVLNHFTARILGVTATPDRGDKRLLSSYFENVAIDVPLLELVQAKYLCPITVKCVPLKLDMSAVHLQSGDFSMPELGHALEPYLDAIALAIRDHASFRKVLAFLPLIDTSHKFVAACNRAGLLAHHIDGDSPDRKTILANFARSDYDVLSNSFVLIEGFDDPDIDCIVILRPTKSRPLYCLDMATEILTENGWASTCQPGTKVASFHVASGTIQWQPALAVVVRSLAPDEHFISIQSQSADIRVSDQHRMLYDNKRKHGWKITTAKKLAALRDTNYIPVAGTNSRADAPLSDADLRFIGWVMTDGSIHKTTRVIEITQGEHQPWLEQIQQCLEECGFKHTRTAFWRKTQFRQTSRCVKWTISYGKPRGRDKHLTGWGRLAPWLTKNFSPLLQTLSTRQFKVMLTAIHLGDGNKQYSPTWQQGSYHICKGNKVFLENLQIAALHNGFRANLSRVSRQSNLWFLHLKDQAWSRIGGHSGDRPAWVVEPHTTEQCWCVTVANGTLITRRNGKVAIVGNCQMLGRGTRIDPLKENLLVLDFLWLHDTHHIVHPADILAKDEAEAEAVTELAAAKYAAGATTEELELVGLFSEVQSTREQTLRDKLARLATRQSKFISAEEFCMRRQNFAGAEYQPTMTWESKPITDSQRKYLTEANLDLETITGRGQASMLLDMIFAAKDLELASGKQQWVMRNHGYPDPHKATRADARKFFDKLNPPRAKPQEPAGLPEPADEDDVPF